MGAVAAVVLSQPLLILVGALIGAAVGYLTERQKVRAETTHRDGDGPEAEG